MHQQQQDGSTFVSDQSMDDLYVAQYLAMTCQKHDVTRFTIGRPAVPPDNVVVSVDWKRKETSITYTYAYREGQDILVPTPASTLCAPTQISSAAAASPTELPAAGVILASTSAAPAERVQPSSNAENLSQPGTSDAPSTTSEPTEGQRCSTNIRMDGLPSGSNGNQPSQVQRDTQSGTPAAEAVQHAVPPHSSSRASVEPGSQPETPQGTTDTASTGPVANETVKTEKARGPNKYRMNLQRHATKIPRTDHYTEWYSSWMREPLTEPPSVRRSPGVLFVHRHKHETEAKWAVQVWMYTRREGAQSGVRKGLFLLQDRESGSEGEWVRVRPGHLHPDLAGYVLHLRDTGEPSWVKTATARVYRSRAHADSSQ